jgi:hypothetical protein
LAARLQPGQCRRPFRAATELAALKLSDDDAELLDLAVALFHPRSEVAHKLMQQRRVARKIREVEMHDGF